MFASIAGLWMAIPAPVRRILEYIGIALLVLWAFKIFWLNPHDNKVAAQATTQATEQVAKQEEIKWKAEYKKLEASKDALAAQLSEVSARNSELVKSREAIAAALNTSLTQYKTIQEGRRAQVDIIPASHLDGALRVLTNGLAAGTATH